MTELPTLIRKRGNVKRKITTFGKFLDEINNAGGNKASNFVTQVQERLDKATNLLDEFNEYNEQIIVLCDENDVDEHHKDADTFEASFFNAITLAKTLINNNSQSHALNRSISDISDTTHNLIGVKLPTIQLPTFTGQYDKWLEFYDTFNSLIHLNESISPIQKFHYLKSALKDEAAAVIQSLEVSASNYAIAWQLLSERFQNKRLIIHNHVSALFNIKQVEKESYLVLRTLTDHVLNHLRALSALKQPTEHWDILLVYLISSKLDSKTRREWESFKTINDMPTFNEFIQFLRERCDVLEAISKTTVEPHSHRSHNTNKNSNLKSTTKNYLVSNATICAMCKDSHLIYNCNEFLKLPIDRRISQVKVLNLCSNCLRKGHLTKDCKSSSCRKCHQKHNTLLHLNSSESNPLSAHPSSTSIVSNHAISNHFNQVLLSTACIKVYDHRGRDHNCRVLLDSGSQSNFITERMCNLLHLNKQPINSSITGINQSLLTIKAQTHARISSLDNTFHTRISCLILDRITDPLPSISFDPSNLQIPLNIRLADPEFFQSARIDMLIGSQLFWQLLSVGQIQLGNNLPVLQKTHLGWIISGSVPTPRTSPSSTFFSASSLEQQLTKFWEIEEFHEPQRSPIDQYCEELFVKTTERDRTGRFVVKIPFIKPISALGESKYSATQRQLSLERKFTRQPQFYESYSNFMEEYESLGHMSLVSESSELSGPLCYLPHHGVTKEDSITTKLRVVFDGSSKSSTGVSLNEIQAAGPALQQDLISILLRFRSHSYAVSADITKMYRQILIHSSQRNLQRIVWRKDVTQPMQTYTLNTVTYGTTSAPFLAMRCLKQLALDNTSQYAHACNSILNDFYVDDLLTGANSEEELTRRCFEIDTILKQAGFELRKWTSNSTKVVENISHLGDVGINKHFVTLGTDSKILGIFWVPTEDSLKYDIHPRQFPKFTKRTILSTIAQIYDPLGLLSSVMIIGKIIIQDLWQLNLHWDESIPIHLHTKWKEFITQLPTLNSLSIPRYVMYNSAESVELHGFCDASNAAYGACIFVRSSNSRNNITVRLLCAKAKVAPLKSHSIPRLELCGALLLAQLMCNVKRTLNVNFQSHYYWCDSTIVLSWLRINPQKLKPFVANRVASIQTLCDSSDWYHVRSENNPADLASRGTLPSDLIERSLWWTGPSWLKEHRSTWPSQQFNSNTIDESMIEYKKTIALPTIMQIPDLFTKYSSFNKLRRVVAYILRFTSNCKLTRTARQTDNLSVAELEHSEIVILRRIQQKCFNGDYCKRQQSASLSSKSPLLSLHPFLDESGLMRVGGRLQHSSFTSYKKHPILLPNSHPITYTIARDEHIRLLHSGPQALLASLRDRYWPLSGRNLTRKSVRECVICFKAKPSIENQLMGSLPSARVRPTRPFLVCGVDYAGPFLIKDRKTRGARLLKSYICLFVCFATKAVHLEVVCDLTTQSFLAALHRFMGRRGHCTDIYSDNATNFVGANNDLQELSNFFLKESNNLSKTLSNEKLNWHFIPPRSPHFGGLWEAGVKSTKHHLKRVLGNTKLTYEEFYTVLVQIEACLNSRPLTPLSSDPSDLNPITPAHFLIGESLVTYAKSAEKDGSMSSVAIFRKLQQMQQHFWERWSKEYISELQQRTKWKTTAHNQLRPGTMVIIKEDNTLPQQWRLGRVIEQHVRTDNLVRVVSIKTASGVIKRCLSRICILPIESQVSQDGGHVQC